MPSRRFVVPAIGLCELGIGGWCAIQPALAGAVAIALIYAGFAAVAGALARRQASCGCFGEDESPATIAQALISATFALMALGVALAGAHGLIWVAGRPAAQAAVLLLSAFASTWAGILAYTEFPRAWGAWSGQ